MYNILIQRFWKKSSKDSWSNFSWQEKSFQNKQEMQFFLKEIYGNKKRTAIYGMIYGSNESQIMAYRYHLGWVRVKDDKWLEQDTVTFSNGEAK